MTEVYHEKNGVQGKKLFLAQNYEERILIPND